MSLIDRTLTSYRYPEEIENFLDTFKAKVCRREPCLATFNELYGILPATQIQWITVDHADNQWGILGTMSLQNAWNQLRMEFWHTGKHWYCSDISFLSSKFTANLAPPFNGGKYKHIHLLSLEILEFLMDGNDNPLFRNAAIRKYIFEQQEKAKCATEKDLLSEIFITLLNLKLQGDEFFNQDLFVKRAGHIVRHVVGERSQYCVSPESMELAKSAAIRGSYLLSDKIYMPINLIWGFLVNEHFMTEKKSFPEQPYYYLEKYYPDSRVEISPLHPAEAPDKNEIIIHRDHDAYKQVFPNYETAVRYHRIAKELITKIGEIL